MPSMAADSVLLCRNSCRHVRFRLLADSVNKWLAKARDGFNHSVAMTLGGYGNNLMITDNAASRIEAGCGECMSFLDRCHLQSECQFIKSKCPTTAGQANATN